MENKPSAEAHKNPCDDIYCAQFLCVQERDRKYDENHNVTLTDPCPRCLFLESSLATALRERYEARKERNFIDEKATQDYARHLCEIDNLKAALDKEIVWGKIQVSLCGDAEAALKAANARIETLDHEVCFATEMASKHLDKLALYEKVLDSRAGRLLLNGSPFFVVKASEPYARQVVDLIRQHEGLNWYSEDEAWALAALAPAPSKEES